MSETFHDKHFKDRAKFTKNSNKINKWITVHLYYRSSVDERLKHVHKSLAENIVGSHGCTNDIVVTPIPSVSLRSHKYCNNIGQWNDTFTHDQTQ